MLDASSLQVYRQFIATASYVHSALLEQHWQLLQIFADIFDLVLASYMGIFRHPSQRLGKGYMISLYWIPTEAGNQFRSQSYCHVQ